jgi:hypothetical protein
MALGRQAAHQGHDATFPLRACGSSPTARVDDPDRYLDDLDDDPATFTIDTAGLPPRTYQLVFECEDGGLGSAELFVYRQTGAERGGAESVVLATGVGLLAAITFGGFGGLPPIVGEETRRRSRSA